MGPQAAVEVEQTNLFFNPVNVSPLNTVFPGSDGSESRLTTFPINLPALTATASDHGIIQPSIVEYTFDVTSVMDNSPTGILSFDIVALDLYDMATLPHHLG